MATKKPSYRWSVSVVVDGSFTVVNVIASSKEVAKMQAAKQAGVPVRNVMYADNV